MTRYLLYLSELDPAAGDVLRRACAGVSEIDAPVVDDVLSGRATCPVAIGGGHSRDVLDIVRSRLTDAGLTVCVVEEASALDRLRESWAAPPGQAQGQLQFSFKYLLGGRASEQTRKQLVAAGRDFLAGAAILTVGALLTVAAGALGDWTEGGSKPPDAPRRATPSERPLPTSAKLGASNGANNDKSASSRMTASGSKRAVPQSKAAAKVDSQRPPDKPPPSKSRRPQIAFAIGFILSMLAQWILRRRLANAPRRVHVGTLAAAVTLGLIAGALTLPSSGRAATSDVEKMGDKRAGTPLDPKRPFGDFAERLAAQRHPCAKFKKKFSKLACDLGQRQGVPKIDIVATTAEGAESSEARARLDAKARGDDDGDENGDENGDEKKAAQRSATSNAQTPSGSSANAGGPNAGGAAPSASAKATPAPPPPPPKPPSKTAIAFAFGLAGAGAGLGLGAARRLAFSGTS